MDTPTENELLQTVVATVADRIGIPVTVTNIEPGLDGQRVDALVRIGQGKAVVTYAAEVKRGLRPATLGPILHQVDRRNARTLLVADYVTPPLAEALKDRGVAFLDAAGNAYIDQPPFFVWIKGERLPEDPAAGPRTGRAFQASGLKVLFALLCHPEWTERPYREIGRLAGVAHGTVGWVMAELPKLGFVGTIAGRRRLLQRELLLKQWVEAYARTLRPKLVLGRYRAMMNGWWTELVPEEYGFVLGGEPAAERLTQYLRPETVTVYGPRPDPRFLLDFRMRADAEGPVEVLKRFWNFQGEDGAVAPLPLVYADLIAIGDARCLETANLLHERIIDRFDG